MESYVTGERGLTNFTHAYMGVGGVKNCQNHAYVINEWHLTPAPVWVPTEWSVVPSFMSIVI